LARRSQIDLFSNSQDFGKDNGPAIKKVCAQFVELCRKMGLL